MRIQAPKGCGNISVGGVEMQIGDGQVDLPDHIAAELMAHHGFTPARPIEIETADDPNSDPGDPIEKAKAPGGLERMKREELFAAARALDLAVSLPIKNEELREAIRKNLAGEQPDDLKKG